MLREYPDDIIPGLTCKLKTGPQGKHLIFMQRGRVKWLIMPYHGEYKLYCPYSRKYSNETGKPDDLMAYIAQQEAYERGLIPPLYDPYYLDLTRALKLLKELSNID